MLNHIEKACRNKTDIKRTKSLPVEIIVQLRSGKATQNYAEICKKESKSLSKGQHRLDNADKNEKIKEEPIVRENCEDLNENNTIKESCNESNIPKAVDESKEALTISPPVTDVVRILNLIGVP